MTSEIPKKTQLRAGLVPGDRSWSIEPSRKQPQTSTTSQPPSHHQIFWCFLSFRTNRCFVWQSFWGCSTWFFFLAPRNLSRGQNHEKLMVPLRPYQSKTLKAIEFGPRPIMATSAAHFIFVQLRSKATMRKSKMFQLGAAGIPAIHAAEMRHPVLSWEFNPAPKVTSPKMMFGFLKGLSTTSCIRLYSPSILGVSPTLGFWLNPRPVVLDCEYYQRGIRRNP